MLRAIPIFLLLSACVAGIGYDPEADESGCVEGSTATVMIVGVGAKDVDKDCP